MFFFDLFNITEIFPCTCPVPFNTIQVLPISSSYIRTIYKNEGIFINFTYNKNRYKRKNFLINFSQFDSNGNYIKIRTKTKYIQTYNNGYLDIKPINTLKGNKKFKLIIGFKNKNIKYKLLSEKYFKTNDQILNFYLKPGIVKNIKYINRLDECGVIEKIKVELESDKNSKNIKAFAVWVNSYIWPINYNNPPDVILNNYYNYKKYNPTFGQFSCDKDFEIPDKLFLNIGIKPISTLNTYGEDYEQYVFINKKKQKYSYKQKVKNKKTEQIIYISIYSFVILSLMFYILRK